MTFPFVRSRRKKSTTSSFSARPFSGKTPPGSDHKGRTSGRRVPRHPRCFRRRVSTGVLKRVCEDGHETGIVRRLCSEISGVLLTCKKGSLLRPRAAIGLNPFPGCADLVCAPTGPPFRAQGRVGHFQHDAAHVFIGKEIFTGKLQLVQRAQHVEKKGSLRQPAKKR